MLPAAPRGDSSQDVEFFRPVIIVTRTGSRTFAETVYRFDLTH
jgi:hypothetical protein